MSVVTVALVAFVTGGLGSLGFWWLFDRSSYVRKIHALNLEIDKLKKSDAFLTQELRKEIEKSEASMVREGDAILERGNAELRAIEAGNHRDELRRKYDELFSRYSMAQAECDTLTVQVTALEAENVRLTGCSHDQLHRLTVLAEENAILADKLADKLADIPPVNGTKVRLVKKNAPPANRVKL